MSGVLTIPKPRGFFADRLLPMSNNSLSHSSLHELLYKLIVLAAHWAGVLRYEAFQFYSLNPNDFLKEIVELRSLLEQRDKQIVILKKQLKERTSKPSSCCFSSPFP